MLYQLSYTGMGTDDSGIASGCPDRRSSSAPEDGHRPASVLASLVTLLWPETCRLCACPPNPGRALCDRCQTQLPPISPVCCRCLHSGSDRAGNCRGCRAGDPLRPMVHLSTHEGALRQLILLGKRQHRDDVAELLSAALAAIIPLRWPDIQETPWVVPVPRHWLRRCRRGVSFAERMAIPLARKLGLRCRHLLRRRRGPTQVSLSAGRRKHLPAGVFQPRIARRAASARQNQVVLIDDVYTTGATLRAATAALEASGLEVQLWIVASVSTNSEAGPGYGMATR
ncbi:MAG: phosphoribosyltransferase family protein [Planctomycetota bacterium]|nr:phosphoribosyltransferase family protein [Planctomycetota bacterium]